MCVKRARGGRGIAIGTVKIRPPPPEPVIAPVTRSSAFNPPAIQPPVRKLSRIKREEIYFRHTCRWGLQKLIDWNQSARISWWAPLIPSTVSACANADTGKVRPSVGHGRKRPSPSQPLLVPQPVRSARHAEKLSIAGCCIPARDTSAVAHPRERFGARTHQMLWAF